MQTNAHGTGMDISLQAEIDAGDCNHPMVCMMSTNDKQKDLSSEPKKGTSVALEFPLTPTLLLSIAVLSPICTAVHEKYHPAAIVPVSFALVFVFWVEFEPIDPLTPILAVVLYR